MVPILIRMNAHHWTSLAFVFGILVQLLAPAAAEAASTRKWVTPDFWIEDARSPFRERDPVHSCRDQIQKIVCLVDPGQEDADFGQPRPCLPGGEAYVAAFENLHDRYPPALQKMFCALDVIFIEREFFGTAYAGVIRDATGGIVGAKLGIRQSVLDQDLDLTTWATWKEQLSFGGGLDSYVATEGLPRVATDTAADITNSDFLYFLIAHEFGHIFDFTNRLNSFRSDECASQQDHDPSLECEMHPDSWGALTWLTDRTAKPENEFPHRRGLCFYWCDGQPLALSLVPQLYADLDQTSFISTYATTQPWDDFADSLAYFLMDSELGTKYWLDTAQGGRYDVMKKLHSPEFELKREYLRAFVQKADILYP
ncbi:MAG: hypothetical protein AAB425_12690 [Bdellovibrionota bacterium]